MDSFGRHPVGGVVPTPPFNSTSKL